MIIPLNFQHMILEQFIWLPAPRITSRSVKLVKYNSLLWSLDRKTFGSLEKTTIGRPYYSLRPLKDQGLQLKSLVLAPDPAWSFRPTIRDYKTLPGGLHGVEGGEEAAHTTPALVHSKYTSFRRSCSHIPQASYALMHICSSSLSTPIRRTSYSGSYLRHFLHSDSVIF